MADDLEEDDPDVDDALQFLHLKCNETKLLVFTEAGFFSKVAYEVGDDVFWDLSYLFDDFRDKTEEKELTSKGFVKLFKETALALRNPKSLHIKRQSEMCFVKFGKIVIVRHTLFNFKVYH